MVSLHFHHLLLKAYFTFGLALAIFTVMISRTSTRTIPTFVQHAKAYPQSFPRRVTVKAFASVKNKASVTDRVRTVRSRRRLMDVCDDVEGTMEVDGPVFSVIIGGRGSSATPPNVPAFQTTPATFFSTPAQAMTSGGPALVNLRQEALSRAHQTSNTTYVATTLPDRRVAHGTTFTIQTSTPHNAPTPSKPTGMRGYPGSHASWLRTTPNIALTRAFSNSTQTPASSSRQAMSTTSTTMPPAAPYASQNISGDVEMKDYEPLPPSTTISPSALASSTLSGVACSNYSALATGSTSATPTSIPSKNGDSLKVNAKISSSTGPSPRPAMNLPGSRNVAGIIPPVVTPTKSYSDSAAQTMTPDEKTSTASPTRQPAILVKPKNITIARNATATEKNGFASLVTDSMPSTATTTSALDGGDDDDDEASSLQSHRGKLFERAIAFARASRSTTASGSSSNNVSVPSTTPTASPQVFKKGICSKTIVRQVKSDSALSERAVSSSSSSSSRGTWPASPSPNTGSSAATLGSERSSPSVADSDDGVSPPRAIGMIGWKTEKMVERAFATPVAAVADASPGLSPSPMSSTPGASSTSPAASEQSTAPATPRTPSTLWTIDWKTGGIMVRNTTISIASGDTPSLAIDGPIMRANTAYTPQPLLFPLVSVSPDASVSVSSSSASISSEPSLNDFSTTPPGTPPRTYLFSLTTHPTTPSTPESTTSSVVSTPTSDVSSDGVDETPAQISLSTTPPGSPPMWWNEEDTSYTGSLSTSTSSVASMPLSDASSVEVDTTPAIVSTTPPGSPPMWGVEDTPSSTSSSFSASPPESPSPPGSGLNKSSTRPLPVEVSTTPPGSSSGDHPSMDISLLPRRTSRAWPPPLSPLRFTVLPPPVFPDISTIFAHIPPISSIFEALGPINFSSATTSLESGTAGGGTAEPMDTSPAPMPVSFVPLTATPLCNCSALCPPPTSGTIIVDTPSPLPSFSTPTPATAEVSPFLSSISFPETPTPLLATDPPSMLVMRGRPSSDLWKFRQPSSPIRRRDPKPDEREDSPPLPQTPTPKHSTRSAPCTPLSVAGSMTSETSRASPIYRTPGGRPPLRDIVNSCQVTPLASASTLTRPSSLPATPLSVSHLSTPPDGPSTPKRSVNTDTDFSTPIWDGTESGLMKSLWGDAGPTTPVTPTLLRQWEVSTPSPSRSWKATPSSEPSPFKVHDSPKPSTSAARPTPTPPTTTGPTKEQLKYRIYPDPFGRHDDVPKPATNSGEHPIKHTNPPEPQPVRSLPPTPPPSPKKRGMGTFGLRATEEDDAVKEWKQKVRRREKEERRREKEIKRKGREAVRAKEERKERRNKEWAWYVAWRGGAKSRVMSRFKGTKEETMKMERSFSYYKAEWVLFDDEAARELLQAWRRVLPAGEDVFGEARKETTEEKREKRERMEQREAERRSNRAREWSMDEIKRDVAKRQALRKCRGPYAQIVSVQRAFTFTREEWLNFDDQEAGSFRRRWAHIRVDDPEYQRERQIRKAIVQRERAQCVEGNQHTPEPRVQHPMSESGEETRPQVQGLQSDSVKLEEPTIEPPMPGAYPQPKVEAGQNRGSWFKALGDWVVRTLSH